MKDFVLDKMEKKRGFSIAVCNCHSRKNKMGKELRENIIREVVMYKMVC